MPNKLGEASVVFAALFIAFAIVAGLSVFTTWVVGPRFECVINPILKLAVCK